MTSDQPRTYESLFSFASKDSSAATALSPWSFNSLSGGIEQNSDEDPLPLSRITRPLNPLRITSCWRKHSPIRESRLILLPPSPAYSQALNFSSPTSDFTQELTPEYVQELRLDVIPSSAAFQISPFLDFPIQDDILPALSGSTDSVSSRLVFSPPLSLPITSPSLYTSPILVTPPLSSTSPLPSTRPLSGSSAIISNGPSSPVSKRRHASDNFSRHADILPNSVPDTPGRTRSLSQPVVAPSSEEESQARASVVIPTQCFASFSSSCACSSCVPQHYSEHPFGEYPSRTLFVRNINSNSGDEEICALFLPFGEIRSVYSQCKHRGFVMISYYDIRHANKAMRALQGRVLRHRRLDIHYSLPKNNPPDKEINQGTLVVFNLDADTKNEDLQAIFGQYGQIKEIRETPNKNRHKFIEFYDVRHAEEAMKHLNKTDFQGKKIKIEPSRPGGVQRARPASGISVAPIHLPAHLSGVVGISPPQYSSDTNPHLPSYEHYGIPAPMGLQSSFYLHHTMKSSGPEMAPSYSKYHYVPPGHYPYQ